MWKICSKSWENVSLGKVELLSYKMMIMVKSISTMGTLDMSERENPLFLLDKCWVFEDAKGSESNLAQIFNIYFEVFL